jgi:hypothetical protein
MAFAGLAAAGAGVALFDWLSSKGTTLTETENVVNSMMVKAIVEQDTSCINVASLSQTIKVVEKRPDSIPSTAFVLSKGCVACTTAIRKFAKARADLDTAAHRKNPKYKIPNSFDSGLSQLLNPNVAMQHGSASTELELPACALPCNAAVVSNQTQDQSYQYKSSCDTSNNITNHVQQSFKAQISQYLKNQQDIIGQTESAFTTDTNTIATNFAASFDEEVIETIRQSLHSDIQSVQSISYATFTGETTNYNSSFFSNVVSERAKISQTANLKAVNDIINNLRQSDSYASAQSLLNKNDTIGSILSNFLGVIDTLGSLFEDLVGKVLIIIAAILIAIIMVVAGLYLTNKQFKNAMNDAMSSTVKNI